MTADHLLIQRFLLGDTAATSQIDHWIAQAAGSYRRRLSEHWEDVLQELRIEVFQLLQKQQFQGKSSLKTYLWQVVNRSCIDQIRSRTRWRWENLDDEENPLPTLESHAGRQERRDLLQRVLKRSSRDCRRMWRMVTAGLSYREMSQRLKTAEGALRVKVMRCRRHATSIREELLNQPMDSRA